MIASTPEAKPVIIDDVARKHQTRQRLPRLSRRGYLRISLGKSYLMFCETTSSIITGLASGVEAIIPVRTVEEARALKLKDPDLLLAGNDTDCLRRVLILAIRQKNLRNSKDDGW